VRPIDIVLLTHDRLEYLARAVDALRQRTPEPIRLTVVDNASGPELRGWLAEHREWFHQLILRPTNEYVPAFQHGIDATSSDPFIVTDPDVVVPELRPSWLARLLQLMEDHPDFGMVGVDLDMANAPSFLTPEYGAALRQATGNIYGELVEGNVGLHFQLIRRAAWRESYYSDARACRSVRDAGYRVGYAKDVRAVHLGWDEARQYPHYLAEKHKHGQAIHAENGSGYYPSYAEALAEVSVAPTLAQLAEAGPLISHTRAAGIPDSAVLELAWARPALGAGVEGPLTLHPPPDSLPPQAAAGAVVLLEPPPERIQEVIHQACDVAASRVLMVANLESVAARLAEDLAPLGWRASEHPIGELVGLMAAAGDGSPALRDQLAAATIEHREAWLALFAQAGFGPGDRRLFAFEACRPKPVPDRVHLSADLRPWRSEASPIPAGSPSPQRRRRWRRATRNRVG
jgi:hypothetical protein